MKAAHRSDDPTGEADADASLHLLIYKAAHNVVFLHIMRVLSDMLRKGMNGRFAKSSRSQLH
jgi:GntR family transcriptional regulator, transcriptional repressor for pyruvate dehydrogenase complex